MTPLEHLHAAVAAVCPITGVNSSSDIFPTPDATAEQIAAGLAIAEAFDFALENAKAEKSNAIMAAYAASVAEPVTAGGLSLLASDEDQSSFLKGLSMLTAALVAQLIQPTTMISAVLGRTVADAVGQSHDMTVSDYAGMCLDYGAQIGAKQADRNVKLAAVEACTTVAEVEAVLMG